MLCPLRDTLYVLLRTGSTQKFMKHPEMTERLLTDVLTFSADKNTFQHYLITVTVRSHPIMPSTHVKELDKQCRSNVDT